MKKLNPLLILLILFCSCANAGEYLILNGQVTVCESQFSAGAIINVAEKESNASECAKKVRVDSQPTIICPFLEDSECKEFAMSAELQGLAFDETQQSTKGLLAVVDTIFNPPTDHNYGGKNLKDTDYLAGFPYGTILKPANVLVLNNLSGQPLPVENFELYQKDGQPLKTQVKDQLIYINSDVMDYEQEYQWRFSTKGKTYVGSFDIAYKEDQQALEQEMAQWLTAQPMVGVGKLVIKAAVTQSYGYTFDYQQAISQAKKILVK